MKSVRILISLCGNLIIFLPLIPNWMVFRQFQRVWILTLNNSTLKNCSKLQTTQNSVVSEIVKMAFFFFSFLKLPIHWKWNHVKYERQKNSYISQFGQKCIISFVNYAQCGNFWNYLSRIFDKNSVKITVY